MSGMFGDLGVGVIVGFVIGYVLKKFVKIVMILIGVYFLSFFWFQQKGVIIINIDKFFNLSENVIQQVLGFGQKVFGIFLGIGVFVVGFYLGFKKG